MEALQLLKVSVCIARDEATRMGLTTRVSGNFVDTEGVYFATLLPLGFLAAKELASRCPWHDPKRERWCFL